MNEARRIVSGLSMILLAAGALSCVDRAAEERLASTGQALLGEQATGSIPSGLPARLTLGLSEGLGTNWMAESLVPWDVRYQYLSKDWVTNWGHGPRDGGFARDYFYDSHDHGFLPAVQFYQIVEEPGGGEDQMLSKVEDPATMRSYFGDFKLLMERAKDYGAPVIVMVEADGFGFLQIQTGGDADHYAAIADSGLPELAALPDTVAGWGLAFLQLKSAVGADNVLLGIHVSAWASNLDVMQNHDVADLAGEVERVYDFLAPFGLVENQTGLTYDFLVGDPSDRDAGYYQTVRGIDKWWDPGPSAAIDGKSFNRFAEWLRLWNLKSGKRWMLWQIPLGNSNHLDVDNAGGARQGYRDNRAEYFLGGGKSALAKFADAGVISLLFGPGMSGMSTHENDLYTDGQLYVKSRAKAVYDAGGLDIAPGLEWSPIDLEPNPEPEREEPVLPSVDFSAQYEWESGLQGWTSDSTQTGALSAVGEASLRGAQSLAVQFSGEGGKRRVSVKSPAIPTGTPYVVFHVRVPEGHGLTSVLPFVQRSARENYEWLSSWSDATEFAPGEWNLVFVDIPSDAKAPFSELGLEFESAPGFSGTVHVDTVGWPGATATTGTGGTGGASTGGGSPTAGAGGTANENAPAPTRAQASQGCSASPGPARMSSLAAWTLLLALGAVSRARASRGARSRRPGGAAVARRATPPSAR